MEQLLGTDFTEIIGRLGDVLREPSTNPTLAGLMIAVVTLIVAIFLIFAILFIVSRTEEDEWDEVPEGEEVVYPGGSRPASTAPLPPAGPRFTLAGIAIAVAVFAGVWAVTGVVTAQSSLCVSCHADNPHARAGKSDPHTTVACVECHETGGVVGSVTYMVAPRTIHFVSGIVSKKTSDDYSRAVPSSSCSRCHSEAIARTVTMPQQGVKVSHKEPIAAGAKCVDCHALADGAVSARTVGMTPCLRCHDGRTASSDCVTCHIKDIASAVRPSVDSTTSAQDLIGTPNCYSCHTAARCDSCHGIRMPHTKEFILHGHARAAANDFWFNGGKTCKKCHTDTRRSCSKCHGPMPSHGGGPGWAFGHQVGNPTSCSQGCHGSKTGSGTRPICEFCHEPGIKPRRSVKPSSAASASAGG